MIPKFRAWDLGVQISTMEKEEIKNGMQSIMSIALNYCNPSHPDVDDWHAVHSIAETIYNSLEGYMNQS